MGRGMSLQPKQPISQKSKKGTELRMFLGSDGGVLGVGAPEVVSKNTFRVQFA